MFCGVGWLAESRSALLGAIGLRSSELKRVFWWYSGFWEEQFFLVLRLSSVSHLVTL